jgi:hypothetical protein
MNQLQTWTLGLLLATTAARTAEAAQPTNRENLPSPAPLQTKIALLRPEQATRERVAELRKQHFTSVALMLTETNRSSAEASAVGAIGQAGLGLDYWIEIARNPTLADRHPEWMASIQTHPEWRRCFPAFGALPSNAVVKVYPWVPALYQETFGVHLQRVKELLAHRQRPAPRRLFLNDLQGGPSACGCGHPLCRWTTDYGPLRSATRLSNNAAALFVAAVKQAQPGVEVVPVWTTECEEADHDRVCGGVNCFKGTCWREWTSQIEPVATETEVIGVLLLDRVFDRQAEPYRNSGGWIPTALNYFQQLPSRYNVTGPPVRRLLPVIQGWDLSSEELTPKVAQAAAIGPAGLLVAFTPIDQSWTPVKFTLKEP